MHLLQRITNTTFKNGVFIVDILFVPINNIGTYAVKCIHQDITVNGYSVLSRYHCIVNTFPSVIASIRNNATII